jgi:hypothetical protein
MGDKNTDLTTLDGYFWHRAVLGKGHVGRSSEAESSWEEGLIHVQGGYGKSRYMGKRSHWAWSHDYSTICIQYHRRLD